MAVTPSGLLGAILELTCSPSLLRQQTRGPETQTNAAPRWGEEDRHRFEGSALKGWLKLPFLPLLPFASHLRSPTGGCDLREVLS